MSSHTHGERRVCAGSLMSLCAAPQQWCVQAGRHTWHTDGKACQTMHEICRGRGPLFQIFLLFFVFSLHPLMYCLHPFYCPTGQCKLRKPLALSYINATKASTLANVLILWIYTIRRAKVVSTFAIVLYLCSGSRKDNNDKRSADIIFHIYIRYIQGPLGSGEQKRISHDIHMTKSHMYVICVSVLSVQQSILKKLQSVPISVPSAAFPPPVSLLLDVSEFRLYYTCLYYYLIQ